MQLAQIKNVLSHWYKFYEGIQLSPQDFYDTLEAALTNRRIPGQYSARNEYSEGGALTPNREYLLVHRERLTFNVCAAPFGSGFFFSWWLTRKPPRHVFLNLLLVLATMAGTFALLAKLLPFGLAFIGFFLTVPVSFMVGLVITALAAQLELTGPEEVVLTLPLVGRFYGRIFAPVTFYKLDTMLMFQSAVQAAVNEVIDSVTTQKGLHALSDDERKPVLQKLA